MDFNLSVIIPVWKHHELAVSHVRENMDGSLIPKEIIVVNDGGEDDLLDKLKSLKRRTNVIYAKILPPKIPWNYTGARNLGFLLSSGNYISIEDQDHIPDKGFYNDVRDAFIFARDADRCMAKWRWEVEEEDVISNPRGEWKNVGNRCPHHDCAVITRELFLRMKGYDERFAGEYGWSNTNWRRRLVMAGCKTINAGYQWVIKAPKTRGLSYRNFRLAKQNETVQPPEGMINFQYEYTRLPIS